MLVTQTQTHLPELTTYLLHGWSGESPVRVPPGALFSCRRRSRCRRGQDTSAWAECRQFWFRVLRIVSREH